LPGQAGLQQLKTKQINMPKRIIIRFIILLVPSFLFVALIFYLFGSYYLKFFMPLFSYEIRQVCPEYEILSFNIGELKKSQRIMYEVIIHRTYIDKQGKTRINRKISGNILASAVYIHPLIIYSLLLAWPVLSIKEKLKSLIISIPLLIIIELIDIPIHLINEMETFSAVDSLSERFRLFYFSFLNRGGRQFLALLVFLISIAPFHLNRSFISEASIGRNDPCPCGSGKKFKKCCMK